MLIIRCFIKVTPMHSNNSIRDILIIVSLALALSLPFINQAFHIDDTNFLYITKQILKDPLRPYSFGINWRGTEERAFDILANPPLCPYYYALIINIFGESERVLHLAHLIFITLSAVFMYYLAKRFTKSALICSLFLVSTPAFMVMSHTIMPDITLLAFYLAGITLFIYGLDRKKNGLLILSGIFMALAGLSRYSGLTAFFVAAMYVLLKGKRIDRRVMLPFLAGGALFLVWCLHNLIFYKQLHFLKASGFQLVTLTLEDIFCKIEAILVYIGSTTIFFIFFVAAFLNKAYKKVFFILASISLYFSIIAKMKYAVTSFQSIFIVAFTVSLLFFIFVAIDKIFAEKNKDIKRELIFFVVWITFIILFTSTLYFVAVKHILLLLPPLIILFVRVVEDVVRKHAKIYLSAAILLTALLGIAVSYADFKYADVYREFALKEAPQYKTTDNTIWFCGHWGFQYYMEKSSGFKSLKYLDNSPQKGDILIIPSLVAEHQWPCRMLQKRLSLLNIYKYRWSMPLRTTNARENFSFYTNVMLLYNPGFLAYYISIQDLEHFVIYRICR